MRLGLNLAIMMAAQVICSGCVLQCSQNVPNTLASVVLDVEANQVTVDCVTAASYPVGDLGPESHNKPHADVGHEDDTNSSVSCA